MVNESSSARRRYQYLAPALLAAGLPFVLYCLTLYPGVGDRHGTGDAIEYQFVGRILSVPHEPGYPQYVLLSHLWSLLPLPLTLASKINLLSAVFTGVAGLFLFASSKLVSRDSGASVLATWMVLLTPNVWLLSTQAEVYSLHLMWVSAVLWAALSWAENRSRRSLAILLFFYALSFGNHLSMITLLPALAFLVLTKDRRVLQRWQSWLLAGVAIAAGLSQYGLMLWRSYNPHPALLPRFPLQASFAELRHYVTGQRFVDRHFLKTGFEDWLPRVWEATVHTVDQLTLPFVLICLIGTTASFNRDRRQTVFLGLVACSVVAFAAAYGIKDSLLYTMPAWFSLGIWGAVGFSGLLQWRERWRSRVLWILVLLVGLLSFWRGAQMRVHENPTELDSVIFAAQPGTGVLAAFKPRRARLLRLYYQYGEELDKARDVEFLAVDRVMETGLEDAGDQTLYFRDPRTAKRLGRAVVDFRQLEASSDEAPVYITSMDRPLRQLTLRPLWNTSLAITLRDRSLDLLGEQTLHLFLMSPKHQRAKGYLALDVRSLSDWQDRLRSALQVAQPEDRVLLVAPRLDDVTRLELAQVLEPLGIDWLSEPPPRHHTIAWWSIDGGPAQPRLIQDLDEELVLELQ